MPCGRVGLPNPVAGMMAFQVLYRRFHEMKCLTDMQSTAKGRIDHNPDIR